MEEESDLLLSLCDAADDDGPAPDLPPALKPGKLPPLIRRVSRPFQIPTKARYEAADQSLSKIRQIISHEKARKAFESSRAQEDTSPEKVPRDAQKPSDESSKPSFSAVFCANTSSSSPSTPAASLSSPRASPLRRAASDPGPLCPFELKNRLVSAQALETKLVGVRALGLRSVDQQQNALTGRWATFGILHDFTFKKDKNGRPFQLWRLTNLEQTNMAVMLFGEAHEHWRRMAENLEGAQPRMAKAAEPQRADLFGLARKAASTQALPAPPCNAGDVICVLSPRILKGSPPSLSVENSDQLIRLGAFPHFARCPARTKAGAICRNPVDDRVGFCIYHANSALRQKSVSRPALGGMARAPGTAIPTPLQKRASLANFLQVQKANRPPVIAQSRDETLQKMLARGTRGAELVKRSMANALSGPAADHPKGKSKQFAKDNDHAPHGPGAGAGAGTATRPGDPVKGSTHRQASGAGSMSFQAAFRTAKKLASAQVDETAPIEVPAEEWQEEGLTSKKTAKLLARRLGMRSTAVLSPRRAPPSPRGPLSPRARGSFSPSGAPSPKLARGWTGGLIDLEIEAPDPNVIAGTRSTLTKEKFSELQARRQQGKRGAPSLPGCLSPRTRRHADTEDAPSPKPKSGLARIFGNPLESLGGTQQVLKMASKNANLAANHAMERLDEELDVLEKKQAIADSIDQIRKIKVNVVVCTKCGIVNAQAAKMCREEGHTLRKAEAWQRFFQCTQCNQRVTATGDRYPKLPCPKCSSTNFKRVSMLKDTSKALCEEMLPRGIEHSFTLRDA